MFLGEMIDDLDMLMPRPIEEKKILAKMARTMARMAHWLADLADPFMLCSKFCYFGIRKHTLCFFLVKSILS